MFFSAATAVAPGTDAAANKGSRESSPRQKKDFAPSDASLRTTFTKAAFLSRQLICPSRGLDTARWRLGEGLGMGIWGMSAGLSLAVTSNHRLYSSWLLTTESGRPFSASTEDSG